MGASCVPCRPHSKGECLYKDIIESHKFFKWNMKQFRELIQKFAEDLDKISDISDLQASPNPSPIYRKNTEIAMISENTLLSLDYGNGRISFPDKKRSPDLNRSQTRNTLSVLIKTKLHEFMLKNFCCMSSESEWFMFHPIILPDVDNIAFFETSFQINIFAWVFPFLRPKNYGEKHLDLIDLLKETYGEASKKTLEKFLAIMIEYVYVEMPKKIIVFILKEFGSVTKQKLNNYQINSEVEAELKEYMNNIFTKHKAFDLTCRIFDKMKPLFIGEDPWMEMYKASAKIEDYLYIENILNEGFYLYSRNN